MKDEEGNEVTQTVAQGTGLGASEGGGRVIQPLNPVPTKTDDTTVIQGTSQPDLAVSMQVEAQVPPTNVAPEPQAPKFDAAQIYPTVGEVPDSTKDGLRPTFAGHTNTKPENVRLATVIAGITRYAFIQLFFSVVSLVLFIYTLSIVLSYYSLFQSFLTDEQRSEFIWKLIGTYILSGIVILISFIFGIYMLIAKNTKNLSTAIGFMLLLNGLNLIHNIYLLIAVRGYATKSTIAGTLILAGLLYYLYTIKRSVDMYKI